MKIADFGLSHNLYGKDYYKVQTRRGMPLKWMALESLEDLTFTTKTDVVGYIDIILRKLLRSCFAFFMFTPRHNNMFFFWTWLARTQGGVGKVELLSP